MNKEQDFIDISIQDASHPHVLARIFHPENFGAPPETPKAEIHGANEGALAQVSPVCGAKNKSALSASIAQSQMKPPRGANELQLTVHALSNDQRTDLVQSRFPADTQSLREWTLSSSRDSAEYFKRVPERLLPLLLQYLTEMDKTDHAEVTSSSSEESKPYVVTEPESDDELERALDSASERASFGANQQMFTAPVAIPQSRHIQNSVHDLVVRCKDLEIEPSSSLSPSSASKGIQMPYYDNEDEWRQGRYIYDKHQPLFSPPNSTFAFKSKDPKLAHFLRNQRKRSFQAEQPLSSSAPESSVVLGKSPLAQSWPKEIQLFDFESLTSPSGTAGLSDETKKAQKGSFDKLLPELLDVIFGYLPRKALFSVALTSKFMFIHAARHLYRTPPLNSLSSYSKFLAKLRAENPALSDPYLCHVRVIDLSAFHLHGAVVTDATAKLLARGCGERLRELNLTGCQKITEREGIQEFIEHCPNIQTAILNGCVNLTDRGLARLAKRWTRLETLHVLGCRSITNKGLRALFRYCHHLESVSVSFAKEATGKGFVYMVKGPAKPAASWSQTRHSFSGTVPLLHFTEASRPSTSSLEPIRRPSVMSVDSSSSSSSSSSDSSASGSGLEDRSDKLSREATKRKPPLPLKYLHVKACGKFTEKHLLEIAKATPHLQTLRLEYNVGSHRLTKRALLAALPYWSKLKTLQIVQPLVSYITGVGRPDILDESDINSLLSTFVNLKVILQKPMSGS